MALKRSTLQRAFVLRSKDLGRRVVSGATYQTFGIVLRTVVSFGSTAVLARLLVPADFGYLAMAMVVTEIAVLFANFGFTNLLIQRRTINRLHIDTVFWASALIGLALTAAVFLASFFAGALFGDATVGELLKVLCLTFAIGSFGTVPHVVLMRLMRFRTEFWIQAITIVARVTVAIAFAWAGYGVWSLVAGGITGALVTVTLGFVAVPYAPRLRFNTAFLSSTWRTSGSYFAGGLLYYASMNVDLLLVGRTLGATSLGYYQSARSLTDEIRARLAVPLQRVLFPAFSALQSEPERMRSVVLRSGRLLAAIIMPVGFGISAVAPELVRVLYGPQWTAMVPLMVTFGLSSALRGSTGSAGPIFNSCNRVALGLKYGVVGTALLVTAVWIGSRWGIEAIAIGVAVVSVYALVPFLAALRLIGLRARHAWQVLGPPFVSAVGMWGAVAASRELLTDRLATPVATLLALVAVGALVYAAALHAMSREYLREFRELLDRVRGR